MNSNCSTVSPNVSLLITVTVIANVFVLVLVTGGTGIMPQLFSVISLGLLFIMVLGFRPEVLKSTHVAWIYPWLIVTLIIIVQLIPFRPFDFDKENIFELKDRISVYPAATVSYWVSFTCYWIVAWLVSILSKKQIVIILIAIGVLSVFEMIYGLFAFATAQEKILGIWFIEDYGKRISGTFINKNHFAAFFELSIPILLSLLALERLLGIKINLPIKIILGIFVILLAFLAVVGSLSRLGLVCFLISITTWFILMIMRNKTDAVVKSHRVILYISIILISFVFIGLWYGLENTFTRFQYIGESGRYDVWNDAVFGFPLSYWIWGAGAGAFVDNFRLLAPHVEGNLIYYQLHNDWLEFILDFGIIGASVIGLSVLFWFRAVKPKQLSVVGIGALSGIVAISVHSIGDFSLQVPGVAILFWVMVGVFMNVRLVEKIN